MTRLLRGIVILCALALPVTVFAIVPDPTLSDTPDCIRLTPTGAFTFNGQVIGTDGKELGDEEVRLVISGDCTDVRLCASGATPPPFVLTTTSGPDGSFSFTPAGGGCCTAASAAEIHADPGDVTLNPIYTNLGSPDNGGDGTSVSDLAVNLPDFSRFAQNYLIPGTCYDYTVNEANPDYCDGDVLLADFSKFAELYLTVCP